MTEPEHGSRPGYKRHLRRNEPPCEECRQANATYVRSRRSEWDDDDLDETDTSGPPAFAGYFATDANGMAIAQLDESGRWLDVDRAIFAPMTYGESQRAPQTYEEPPLDPAETLAWVQRCRQIARGQLSVTEGELGEAVELVDRQTGEVVWQTAPAG
jgi:hypothetical protein